jgi:mRNA-degrading endonuclease RelE of RelBE toxin-antitoxin system
MSRSVGLTQRAFRDLGSLDPVVARRVVAKLERAAGDPSRFFARLAGSDECKMRVGDYRVVATLAHATKVIVVARTEHRSRVYARR